MTQVSDLDTRAHIHDLVVRFYREIAFDDILGPVFAEVGEVDWSIHIPKLIDYWCRVLLGHPGYDGFILAPHQQVNDRQPFAPELFDRWFALFAATVDSGWRGPIAERAKSHAERTATMLARRLISCDWAPAGEPHLVTASPCQGRGRPTGSTGGIGSRLDSGRCVTQ